MNLKKLDETYTVTRRTLWKDPDWRQGSNRVYIVFKEAFDALTKFSSVIDCTYMDLGCGVYHPLGICAAMYLNGITNTIAFDKNSTDENRASEALYDLLADCATQPDKWHISNIDRSRYLSNIYKFDIEALKNGELWKGIENTNLMYIVGEIQKCPIDSNSIHLLSSRAVLEHFLNFELSISELYRILTPGGIAFHSIDLMDHRIYREPNQYNIWSFLTEDENWSDGLCNRLRANEIITIARRQGFDVTILDTRTAQISSEIKSKLKGRFTQMSDDELSIVGLDCVFIKQYYGQS